MNKPKRSNKYPAPEVTRANAKIKGSDLPLEANMAIKSWFLNKEFTQGERYAISTADDPSVVRETEKALLLKWKTEFGFIQHWVPKSVVI